MAKGISVHVGVNNPKPSFGVNPLLGCVNDANTMFQIAKDNGFEAKPPFLNKEATLANVEAAILDAAGKLVAGDIFLFTFAGHGSTKPTTFSVAEPDSQDETILLFDCILIDNYLRRNLWSEFKKDVRILGIADSCHSGTALSEQPPPPTAPIVSSGKPTAAVSVAQATLPRSYRTLTDPPLVIQRPPVICKNDRAFSEADRRRILEVSPEIHNEMKAKLKPLLPLKATLLTLGACDDLELARDGADNGVFTGALKQVWSNGAFQGNYEDFIGDIGEKTSPEQHPILGPMVLNPNFVNQRPFMIS